MTTTTAALRRGISGRAAVLPSIHRTGLVSTTVLAGVAFIGQSSAMADSITTGSMDWGITSPASTIRLTTGLTAASGSLTPAMRSTDSAEPAIALSIVRAIETVPQRTARRVTP